jgi:hypothetical protein
MATFCNNPKYSLQLTEEAEVFISLAVPDARIVATAVAGASGVTVAPPMAMSIDIVMEEALLVEAKHRTLILGTEQGAKAAQKQALRANLHQPFAPTACFGMLSTACLPENVFRYSTDIPIDGVFAWRCSARTGTLQFW